MTQPEHEAAAPTPLVERRAIAMIIDPDPDVWSPDPEDMRVVSIRDRVTRRKDGALAKADAILSLVSTAQAQRIAELEGERKPLTTLELAIPQPWRTFILQFRDKLKTAEAERDEARTGLEKAREALEPFAAACGFIGESTPDTDSIEVAVRLFRKARAVLASLNTGARSE